MNFKTQSIFFLILVFSGKIIAQPYSAYVDVRQEFYAFDNGAINKLDHLQPVDYQIGKNSIAFIDTAGKIGIRLDVRREDSLEVCISDTGAGIKAASLDKIFQPFFTTRKQGTGLGLSICRQIVEAHKGNISVESVVGEGTTVTLSLPLGPGDD